MSLSLDDNRKLSVIYSKIREAFKNDKRGAAKRKILNCIKLIRRSNSLRAEVLSGVWSLDEILAWIIECISHVSK